MKKLFFSMMVLVSSITANSQIDVHNNTSCDYYLTMEVVVGCTTSYDVTYHVPANALIVLPTLPTGESYERGLLHSHYLASPAGYYAKFQKPGATMGWPALCWAGPYNTCGQDTDCNGLTAEICWDGSPTNQVLNIVN